MDKENVVCTIYIYIYIHTHTHTYIYTYIYIHMHIYIHTYIYICNGMLLTIKNYENLPFVTTWKGLKGNILSKINQIEKDKYCMVSLICRI